MIASVVDESLRVGRARHVRRRPSTSCSICGRSCSRTSTCAATPSHNGAESQGDHQRPGGLLPSMTPTRSRRATGTTTPSSLTQVLDYVSGMTDRYALRIHDELFRPKLFLS